jgi:hypothetical protein
MIQVGVGNAINAANVLFGSPVPQGASKITFDQYSQIVAKVNCGSYIGFSGNCSNGHFLTRLDKIIDYSNELLPELNPIYQNAINFNQPELNSNDLCTKQVAEKTKTLLETQKQEAINQQNKCLDYMESLPCPGLMK